MLLAHRLKPPFVVELWRRLGRAAAEAPPQLAAAAEAPAGAAMRMAIAQYYPRPSLIHRLDPRCKVVAVTALVVGLFLRSSFAALAVYGLAAAAGLLLSGVPLGWIARGLRPVLWLLVLTFVVQLLFAPGPAFDSLGPLHLSTRGLAVAGYLSLRLVVLVVASLLLTLTTPPDRADRRAGLAGPAAAPPARAHRGARPDGDHRPALHPHAHAGDRHDHEGPAGSRGELQPRRAAAPGAGARCRCSCRCSS